MSKTSVFWWALVACCALATLASAAIAATTVNLKVLNSGRALANTNVRILSSTGITDVTTNELGDVVFQLRGRYFRVRVDATTKGAFKADGQPIVVDVASN